MFDVPVTVLAATLPAATTPAVPRRRLLTRWCPVSATVTQGPWRAWPPDGPSGTAAPCWPAGLPRTRPPGPARWTPAARQPSPA